MRATADLSSLFAQLEKYTLVFPRSHAHNLTSHTSWRQTLAYFGALRHAAASLAGPKTSAAILIFSTSNPTTTLSSDDHDNED